jgi:hypothetical protein
MTGTSDWTTVNGRRGRYFVPMTTGVNKVTSHMIALTTARTNHRTATSNCCSRCRLSWVQHSVVCGENLSWDVRLVVWRKFNFFCGTAVSSICVTQITTFYCYEFHFIYMHAWCVSCNRERHNAACVW